MARSQFLAFVMVFVKKEPQVRQLCGLLACHLSQLCCSVSTIMQQLSGSAIFHCCDIGLGNTSPLGRHFNDGEYSRLDVKVQVVWKEQHNSQVDRNIFDSRFIAKLGRSKSPTMSSFTPSLFFHCSDTICLYTFLWMCLSIYLYLILESELTSGDHICLDRPM